MSSSWSMDRLMRDHKLQIRCRVIPGASHTGKRSGGSRTSVINAFGINGIGNHANELATTLINNHGSNL